MVRKNLGKIMNIEIANEKYWKTLKYYDALLYCSLLVIDGKNDWRIPNSVEFEENIFDITKKYGDVSVWFDGHDKDYVPAYAEWVRETLFYLVLPVRDI